MVLSLSSLPFADTQTLPPSLVGEPESRDRETRRSQRKPRILVVDDEGLIADSIAEILNGNGYEATPAYGGQAAIELAEQTCPDLLLTDVLMPTLNGIETALKVSQNCSRTRILLFSGQARTSDLLNKAKGEGLEFDLLPKPIHPQQLLRKLASVLQG